MSLAVVGPLIINWSTRRTTVVLLKPADREQNLINQEELEQKGINLTKKENTPRRNPGRVLRPGIVKGWVGSSLEWLDPPTNKVGSDFIPRQTSYSEVVDNIDERLERRGSRGACGPRRNLIRLFLWNNEDRVRIFDLKVEPPRPPFAARGRALEGDITRLQAIPKSEPDASRHPVGLHPTQLVVEAKEIEKGLYPNIGLTKMRKDAKEGDRIGVQYLLLPSPWFHDREGRRLHKASSATRWWRMICQDPSPIGDRRRKTIEVQNQEKKFGRCREKTAENVVLDRNHAT
jgi:hypothetical protein